MPTIRPLFAVFLLGAAAAAQTVELAGGEVLPGRVVAVEGTRAKVQAPAGGLRQFDVRTLLCERAADGTRSWHAASAASKDGPGVAALIDRLRHGEAVPVPELMAATAAVGEASGKAIAALLADKAPAVRGAAAVALLAIGTEASVGAVLAAAAEDVSGELWRLAGPGLTTGACLGAMQSPEAKARLESALGHKDRDTRAAIAWCAVCLGSEKAQPVLAAYLADSDHHRRESAAFGLAEVGNAAGASVLIAYCKRERSREEQANQGDPSTRELVARGAMQQRIRACELLGTLRVKTAAGALKALAKHENADLAAAAKKALAALDAK